MFDEYIEVEARLKEVVVGTTTVAHKEVGLASTIAALKGDWLAAMYLSPNKTTYTTRPISNRIGLYGLKPLVFMYSK